MDRRDSSPTCVRDHTRRLVSETRNASICLPPSPPDTTTPPPARKRKRNGKKAIGKQVTNTSPESIEPTSSPSFPPSQTEAISDDEGEKKRGRPTKLEKKRSYCEIVEKGLVFLLTHAFCAHRHPLCSIGDQAQSKDSSRKRQKENPQAAETKTRKKRNSSGKSTTTTTGDSQPDSLDDFQTVVEGGVKKPVTQPNKRKSKRSGKDISPNRSDPSTPNDEHEKSQQLQQHQHPQQPARRGVITATCLGRKQKAILDTALAKLSGFTYSEDWTDEVTHLVTVTKPKRTMKVLKSLAKVSPSSQLSRVAQENLKKIYIFSFTSNTHIGDLGGHHRLGTSSGGRPDVGGRSAL